MIGYSIYHFLVVVIYTILTFWLILTCNNLCGFAVNQTDILPAGSVSVY